jgi:hypothetical protein
LSLGWFIGLRAINKSKRFTIRGKKDSGNLAEILAKKKETSAYGCVGRKHTDIKVVLKAGRARKNSRESGKLMPPIGDLVRVCTLARTSPNRLICKQNIAVFALD